MHHYLFIATFIPITGKLNMARKVPEIKDFDGFYRRIHITVSTCFEMSG